MSDRVHVAVNAGYALMGTVAYYALAVVHFIIVSRYLRPVEMGVYSYVSSIVETLMVMVDLGISTMMVREIARDRAAIKTLMPQVLGIKATIGFVLMVAVMAVGGKIATGPEAGGALALMAVMLFVEPLCMTYIIVFQGTEKLKYSAIAQVARRGAMLAALPVVILAGLRIKGIISTHFIGAAVVFSVIYYLVAKNYGRMGIGFDLRKWTTIVKKSVPFLAMSLIWVIYNRIDQVMIPYLDSMEANGYYSVAYKYSFLFIFIPQSVSSIIFPYFSRKSLDSREAIKQGVTALYRYMGILGLGMIVFVGIPSREWIVLMSGDNYLPAESAMTVLVICMVGVFFYTINITTLYSFDRQDIVIAASVFSVTTNVVLDFLLIPVYGFMGAAYATLCCSSVMVLITYIAISCELEGIPSIRILSGPLISALVAGLLVYYVGNPLTGFVAGIAAFIILLLLTKSINRYDIDLIGDVVRQLRTR